MKHGRITFLSVLAGLIASYTSSLFASPEIGNVDHFDGIGSPTATWVGTGNNFVENGTTPYYQFTLTTPGNNVPGEGTVLTTSTDYRGDYGALPGAIVSFKLTTFDDAPTGLNLYFATAAGGGQVWTYSFESVLPTGPGTATFSAPISYYSTGWFTADIPLLNQPGAFAAALAGMTSIGISIIGGTTTGPDVYAMDEFAISVPEPETVWMILAVVLSLGVTFRSQLAGLAGQAKAMVFKG